MWFEIKDDKRITERCASEGCGGQVMYRLEADGVGSYFCSGCRADIETIPGRLAAARDFLSNLT